MKCSVAKGTILKEMWVKLLHYFVYRRKEVIPGTFGSYRIYCWILLVFFLHALLTMHGHRNIKPTVYFFTATVKVDLRQFKK